MQCQQCSRHGQRHGQHDHERMQPALELRRQHQVDHYQTQHEGKDDCCTAELEVPRLSLVIDDHVGRQVFLHQLIEPVECVAERDTVRQVGLQGDRAHPVIAVQCDGVGKLLQPDQVGQRDQLLCATRAYVDVLQVGRRALGVALALEDDIVLLAGVDVGGDAPRAEQCFEGPADAADGDAEFRGALVVDLDAQLRLGFLVVPVQPDQSEVVLLDLLDQDVAPLGQLRVGAAAQHVLHGFLDPRTEALAHHGKGADTGQVLETVAHVIHDVPRRAAVGPVVQHVDDDAGVEDLEVAEGARCAHQQAADFAVFHQRHHALFDLGHVGCDVLVGGSFRSRHHQVEHATVFLGGVFVRNLLEQPE